MKARYSLEDLQAIVDNKTTCQEVADKYGVRVNCIYASLNRHHLRVGKKAISIITPYGTKIVYGMPECADELKVSISTVNRALLGKRPKLFEEMNIKVEYRK